MIIGLVGFAGSGKDTVGKILESKGFVRESFAKPVKDAVSVIFGWDRNKLEGRTTEDRNWREEADEYWSNKFGKLFSPRKALQLMGTEIGRDIYHPNLWVDALEKRIENFKNVVITDVRFVNEMKMIKQLGGKIIQIERGSRPPWYYDAVAYNQLQNSLPESLSKIHISEWGWIGNPLIDRSIQNNFDLEDLELAVFDMLRMFDSYK